MEDGPGVESMSIMYLVYQNRWEYTNPTRLTSRRGALPFVMLGRCEGAVYVSDLWSDSALVLMRNSLGR